MKSRDQFVSMFLSPAMRRSRHVLTRHIFVADRLGCSVKVFDRPELLLGIPSEDMDPVIVCPDRFRCSISKTRKRAWLRWKAVLGCAGGAYRACPLCQ